MSSSSYEATCGSDVNAEGLGRRKTYASGIINGSTFANKDVTHQQKERQSNFDTKARKEFDTYSAEPNTFPDS
jgi:hypothetical protein